MYRIIITENVDEELYRSQLYFDFETLEEAKLFIDKILSISEYRITIIPLGE